MSNVDSGKSEEIVGALLVSFKLYQERGILFPQVNRWRDHQACYMSFLNAAIASAPEVYEFEIELLSFIWNLE